MFFVFFIVKCKLDDYVSMKPKVVYGSYVFNHCCYIYMIYIDDIFMIWQYGEEKLKEFLKILNSCHPTIKFTSEYSLDKVNFLDVEVIRSGNKLLTDL